MPKLIVPIRGMHCASCEMLIAQQLKQAAGVRDAAVNHRRGLAEVLYEAGSRPSNEDLIRAVQAAGYDVGQKEALPWISRNIADYKDLLHAAMILMAIYYIARYFNLFNLDLNTSGSGVGVALLVGLIAGVSTCMALIGGLVLSLSARHAELHPEASPMQKFRPHIYFNLGRIVGYGILGGVIGLIGQAFKPSNNLLGFLTMFVGGVMIFLGLKLVEIFPVLKDKSITLPSSIAKLFGLQREVKEYSHKSAMIMGALTFFLPCGFTQAMQLYAVSTGSFWQGMAVMGLFAIGTAPGLLSVGGLTSVFRGRKARLFFMTAGLAVILLGLVNVQNGSLLFSGVTSTTRAAVESSGEPQVVNMTQTASGYTPSVFTVEKGRPVRWIINSTSAFSCATSLVLPKYGINESLKPGENVITFTPTEVGKASFSCSMGMYRGYFNVVEPGKGKSSGKQGSSLQAAAAALPGSSCGGSGGGCGGCGGGNKNLPPTLGNTGTGVLSEQTIVSAYTYRQDIVPNTFTVQRGKPVRFTVDVQEDGRGCMSTIMVPGLYNNPEPLIAGTPITMTFTPEEAGEYPITCAMGVPRGVIKVVN